MLLKKWLALWQHRYRKIAYILAESLAALATIARFGWLKISFLGKKKLVLIIRTEHFGDIVAAEPIARQVRHHHPHDHLVWLVRPAFKELVKNHPDLNQIWQQRSVFYRLLVCKSGIFDEVYNLEFWQSNFDPVLEIAHKNQAASQQDISVFNYFEKGSLLTIFQMLGQLPLKDEAPRVYISENDRQVVNQLQLPPRTIVVHCSSNYPVKDWSVAKWEALINWLIVEKGYSVVEIGLKSANAVSNEAYYNCCGRLSILQTAEVIRRADYFVGIDSGPAHLANAVGTFGFLLFGKLNNFDGYMPYSGTYQTGQNATMINQNDKTCAELDFNFAKNKISERLLIFAQLQSVGQY